MATNVYNYLSALILLLVVIGGIQGLPSRRLDDQRSHERSAQISEAALSNRNEAGARVREPSSTDFEPRTKGSGNVRQRNMDSDGKIVFPSDLPDPSTRRNFVPPSTAICKNATFCENPPNYPEELIKAALLFREDLNYLATVDTVPEISQRIDADNDVPLCVYEDKVILPKSAENKNNTWQYVINDENFTQGVRIEECKTENTPCSLIEGFSEGYRTSCKQKYVYRELAAVSTDGNLEKNLFKFAASCCCHVKFTGNPALRFGVMVGAKSNQQSPAPRTIRSVDGKRKK